MREAPQRTCVGCRKRRAKHDLLRLARTPDGIRFDPAHRLPGRGTYVCPTPACITAAARRDGQAIRRALRGAPHDEVHTALHQLHAAVRDGEASDEHEAPKEQNA